MVKKGRYREGKREWGREEGSREGERKERKGNNRKREREGKARGKRREREEGRVGKEIKLLATLYTPASFDCTSCAANSGNSRPTNWNKTSIFHMDRNCRLDREDKLQAGFTSHSVPDLMSLSTHKQIIQLQL